MAVQILGEHFATAITIACCVTGCAGRQSASLNSEKKFGDDPSRAWFDPASDYPEQAKPEERDARHNPNAKAIAITGATVMTAAGELFPSGTVITEGGSITYVGPATAQLPAGAKIIDAKGKFITPGLIDAHSHIGVYSQPFVDAQSDGNEMTSPATPSARALYAFNPQDPAITRARAGGVTSALVLPGSANLIGGHGQAVIMKPGRHSRDVAFPGAPPAIKMACGENPKRVYGEKGGPATRMGEYARFRALFQQAADYRAKKRKYARDYQSWQEQRDKALAGKSSKKGKNEPSEAPAPPTVDAELETLARVLDGEFMVQIHCYRGHDIAEMIAITDEFGIKVRAFHHALEAYKVRDLIASRGTAIATWADWWGFKMEALDGIPENAALFYEAGGRAIIHSDSSMDIQRLNQEAGKAYYAGLAAGIKLNENDALRWITANPAWAMGLDDVIGTIEKDKRADLVIWSGHPFSVYSKADFVIQAGEIAYDRAAGITPTDFELGNSAQSPSPAGASR